jgi:hypothetical protein
MERCQNSLSLPCCAFFLILYQSQSAEFCEIVVAETESALTFCCRRGYFGVLVCFLCSMDEMLIRFSLVFDRWMTTPMAPLEPTDGSLVTGCTALGFPPCFRTCCTALATRGFPRTVAVRTSVRARVLQGPCGHSGSPHRPDHDGLVYHGLRGRPRRLSGEGCPPSPHGVL